MIRGSAKVAALLIAASMLVSGCSETKKAPPPTIAVPTVVTPIFRTKSDALARAKTVYERYLSIGQQISQDGGKGVDRFSEVLTDSALAVERKGAKVLVSRHLASSGQIKLTAFKLQDADLTAGSVAAYACVDLSAVRVKTSSGKDVTPKDRPPKQTVRPTFVWESGRLKLEANGTWSGSSVCK